MAATIIFNHQKYLPDVRMPTTAATGFVMVSFSRDNSQRKAATNIPLGQNLNWPVLPKKTGDEFFNFFLDRAKDGKAFWYQAPSDEVQRQYIVQPESELSYTGITANKYTLSVTLLEVFDV